MRILLLIEVCLLLQNKDFRMRRRLFKESHFDEYDNDG